jgi:7,8-dihydropterin-6-yl-methyl-4-(beta-D-ribofuranosyl)aminobenzene 5'-phosphate synthase
MERRNRLLPGLILFACWAAALAGQEPAVRVTYLYDNTVAASGVKPDWGFACLVVGHGRTVLFDTGAKADILRGNLAALNVDLSRVDALVLSHDHLDHTGGLDALGMRVSLPAYYARGFDPRVVDSLSAARYTPIPVHRSVEIFPGIRVSDEMVLKAAAQPPASGVNPAAPATPAIAEEALLVDTPQGLVVIVGCAHPGIVSMLRQIKQTTNRPIYMVLGGFHLLQTGAAQVRQIVSDFKSLGVVYAGPTHCTGDEAIRLFREAYGDHFIQGGVGTVVGAPVIVARQQ